VYVFSGGHRAQDSPTALRMFNAEGATHRS
jgi:hypothetical protein